MIMKIFIIIFLLFAHISCDSTDEYPKNSKSANLMNLCYKLGPEVTQQSCVSDKCKWMHVSIGFLADLNGSPCIQGKNANAYFAYRTKPVMPVCFPIQHGEVDSPDRYRMYCKHLTNTAVYMFGRSFYDFEPPSSDGWFPCDEQFSWCEEHCGNGTVEPWEHCEPDMTPVPLCQDFSMTYYGYPGFSRGMVKCDQNCQFDLSDCQL